MQKPVAWLHLHRATIASPFPYLKLPFSMLPLPQFLYHKYPQPLAFRETDLRLFPSPDLDASGINPFYAANLIVSAFGLRRTRQTNKTLLFFPNSHMFIHLANIECQLYFKLWGYNSQEIVCFSSAREGNDLGEGSSSTDLRHI